MRPTLRDEIRALLADRVPRTAIEISLEVRARRADVDETLTAGGFLRAETPSGANPRSVHWENAPVVSRPVPVAETDADWLARHLGDGRWHGLGEIIRASQADRGCGLTVHSRASELRRKRGLNIEQRPVVAGGRRSSEYRLVSGDAVPLAEPEPTGRETAPPSRLSPVQDEAVTSPAAVLPGPGSGSASDNHDGLPVVIPGQLALVPGDAPGHPGAYDDPLEAA